MKNYLIIFLLCYLASACRQSVNEPKPDDQLTSFLSGNFKAVLVKENNTVVYQLGAGTHIIPGYMQYKMEFSGRPDQTPRVKFTEYTGEVFQGKWEISAQNSADPQSFRLKLADLTPQPAQSNGVIEFQILSWTSTSLELKAVKSNPKTSNSVNEYRLQKE